eukprot:352123-Chlamydomonas_euryale.AAC.3
MAAERDVYLSISLPLLPYTHCSHVARVNHITTGTPDLSKTFSHRWLALAWCVHGIAQSGTCQQMGIWDRADETAASQWPFVRDTLAERITTTAAVIMLSCSAHNMPSGAGRGICCNVLGAKTGVVSEQRTAVQWNSNADWLLPGWIDSSSVTNCDLVPLLARLILYHRHVCHHVVGWSLLSRPHLISVD